LAFNGHEAVAEKRTAFEIAADKPVCISGTVRLEFDLNFISYNHIYFGYILRIVNDNQNIDLIYDQKTSLFRVISGQHFFNISFSCDAWKLYNEWNRVSVTMDLKRQQIALAINNKNVGRAAFSFKGNCFKFLYGANDDERFHTRDIPPMRIKDIRIFQDEQLTCHWPLEEVADTLCYDDIRREPAKVKNGVWLKPGHQYWKTIASFQLNGNAVVAFDQRNEQLLITGIDSVITYDLRQQQHARTAKAAGQENILIGCQSIYDTLSNQLYNVYIDHKKVAAYSPGHPQWTTTFPDTILTEFWHANKFISPVDTALYIIGGYGQLKYKNLVQRWQPRIGKWETLSAGGSFFPPRYLAGLGLNATGDTAFIIGGYGSMTGDQMLDPREYHDLFAFDVRSRTFSKRFSLDSVYGSFTFANSLVIDAKRRQYYGLVFPKDSFNSRLQLIEGSLDRPVYKLRGTPVLYSFYDVQSFADLYYAPGVGKLIAVTLLYDDQELRQRKTNVHVYTIDFPPLDPEPGKEKITGSEGFLSKWLIFMLLFFVAAIGALWWRFVLQKNKEADTANKTEQVVEEPEPVLPHTAAATIVEEEHPEKVIIPEDEIMDVPEVPRSGIRLFGPFQAFNEQGEEMTGLFTPLMKELLLLILIYTVRTGQGITADELNEILWNGKSAKDAKNNRSVNLAKLKSILEKIGNCMVNKKSVYWQFQYAEDGFYLDYERFVSLTKRKTTAARPFITDLLKVVETGAFLAKTEYDWLDDIKAEVSNAVIDLSLGYLNEDSQAGEDPEFVIRVTNAVFLFDRLNEEALEYKCKSLIQLKRYSLANNTYEKFVKDYRDIYGEEFYKSFNDVIR
jgi:Na+-transporting methylmalonyl-CoA/oxaloacetate decarboxylase gamma subunit